MITAIVVDSNYGSVSREKLERVRDALAGRGIDLQLAHCEGEDGIIARCAGAQAILGTGNPPVTARVLDALPELRLVSRFGVGVNSIDLEAAGARGIPITFMPGFCATELAEHATALILGLMRNLGYYDRRVRALEWPKCGYFVPRNLHSCVLGLVGFGAAARRMAAVFGRGFGARVLAFDPYVPAQAAEALGVETVDFDTLLAQSDIVSIHAPLTPQTRGLFGEEQFRKMKSNALLVNVSRGGIIDEAALARALENGLLRGAGLDVFDCEPVAADNPLLKLDNVLLTPHSASYGESSGQQQVDMAVETLDRAFNEGKIYARLVANRAQLGEHSGFCLDESND